MAVFCLKSSTVEAYVDQALTTMRERLRKLIPFSGGRPHLRRHRQEGAMSTSASIQNQSPDHPFAPLSISTHFPLSIPTYFQEPPTPTQPPIPIHELATPINPQNNSPLFNGRIPPEIRNEIFSYALTETPKGDPYSDYISRPGYTHRNVVYTSLLQTCRLIYLETNLLPITNKEHVFWHAPKRGPYGYRFPDLYSLDHEKWYFNLMTSWQLKLVKEVHLFTQLFWLEGQFARLCKKDYISNVEKLKITIRRGDWWWNETNDALFINPKRSVFQAWDMLRTIQQEREATREGRSLEPFHDHSWGSAFRDLPALKELEMEFETSDDKLAELETIVEWAKTWRFPMGEKGVLSAVGEETKRWSWEGNMTYWSDQCPYCRVSNSGYCVGRGTTEQKLGCIEREGKRERGEGPTLIVRQLRWKLVEAVDGQAVRG